MNVIKCDHCLRVTLPDDEPIYSFTLKCNATPFEEKNVHICHLCYPDLKTLIYTLDRK
jgi:hypothetical protein